MRIARASSALERALRAARVLRFPSRMRWFACPICTLISKERALCASCAEELYIRREPIVRDVGPYAIRSLFSWRRDEWPALRWWATALKQKEEDAFWREPATWALDQWGQPCGDVDIVPIPTARDSNHALGFARAIARRSGGVVKDGLRVKSSRRQKRLDQFARRGRRFELDEDYYPRTRVIVIDDIATTGATAEAAIRALGQPASCEVWCLMDRRPRGEGRNLFDTR